VSVDGGGVATATAAGAGAGDSGESDVASPPVVIMKPTFVPSSPVKQEKTIVNSEAAAFFSSNRMAQLLQEEAKFRSASIVDSTQVQTPEPYKPRMSTAIDPSKVNQESRLSDEEFKAKLGVSREQFNAMPAWKQKQIKKDKGIF